jgi:hypothetical protein
MVYIRMILMGFIRFLDSDDNEHLLPTDGTRVYSNKGDLFIVYGEDTFQVPNLTLDDLNNALAMSAAMSDVSSELTPKAFMAGLASNIGTEVLKGLMLDFTGPSEAEQKQQIKQIELTMDMLASAQTIDLTDQQRGIEPAQKSTPPAETKPQEGGLSLGSFTSGFKNP